MSLEYKANALSFLQLVRTEKVTGFRKAQIQWRFLTDFPQG